MVLDKSCPGSRTIREPRPEYMNCPDCGREVEIWTDELKATCPGCGGKVYRAQQVSCIDWCPHAKECVGPEVYERLRPGAAEATPETDSPLDILKRDHDRAQDTIALLRGASLCLKLGALAPQSAIQDRGLEHLDKVLAFFEKDLGLHFRREEEVLFPVLEKHIGRDKSPTQLLLEEHQEVWRHYDNLKEKLVELRADDSKPSATVAEEIQEISRHIESLLLEHIKKENESLFPLATGLLSSQELETTGQRLRKLTL